MLQHDRDRPPLPRRLVVRACAGLLAVALPVAMLQARRQTGPATFSGVIYDPSGAVLPAVALTLEGPQSRWTAGTDASGHFEFPEIAPGAYQLSATLPGFKTLRQQLTLATARDWTRAITLQVGDVQETITVRASRVTSTATPVDFGRATRIGGNIRPPRKLVDVRPEYPTSMRDAGLEGTVPLDALIGVDGTVTSVRVASAQVHPEFARAAIDAVRQWRFSPTLLNGEAIEVVMTVSVRFSLQD